MPDSPLRGARLLAPGTILVAELAGSAPARLRRAIESPACGEEGRIARMRGLGASRFRRSE